MDRVFLQSFSVSKALRVDSLKFFHQGVDWMAASFFKRKHKFLEACLGRVWKTCERFIVPRIGWVTSDEPLEQSVRSPALQTIVRRIKSMCIYLNFYILFQVYSVHFYTVKSRTWTIYLSVYYPRTNAKISPILQSSNNENPVPDHRQETAK